MGELRTALYATLVIAFLAPLAAAVTGTVAVSGEAENSGTVDTLPQGASDRAAVSFDTDAAEPVWVSSEPSRFGFLNTAEATVGWAAEGAPTGGAAYTVDVTVDGETTSVTLP